MNPLEPYDEEAAEAYFTCQCNPPFEKWRDGEDGGEPHLYAHRVPIDCMTAEDWQRIARAKQDHAATVWVVEVNGDIDCGYPNDGVIGIFENAEKAWAVAMLTAQANNGGSDEWEVSEEGINIGRADVFVKKLEVQ